MRVFGRKIPQAQPPAPAPGVPGVSAEDVERERRKAAEAQARVTAADKAREAAEAQVAQALAARDRVILDTWIHAQAASGRVQNPGHFGALVRDRFVVRDGVVHLKEPPKDKPDAKPEDFVAGFLKGEGMYLVSPAVPQGAGAGRFPGAPAGGPPRDLSSNEGLTRFVREGGSFLAQPDAQNPQ